MEENKEQKAPMGIKGVEAVEAAAEAGINKKLLIWTGIALLVVLILAGGTYYWHHSGSEKALEAIGQADLEQNDSIRAAMYQKIADDGSFKANERAKLMTAIQFYNDGKYEEALKYVKQADVDSPVIQAGAYSLEGDCYANLKKYDEALKAFNKALGEADDNPQLVPFILVKMANIYRAQKDYVKEYEVYNTLRTDYPGFMYDVEKYYERAKEAAGK